MFKLKVNHIIIGFLLFVIVVLSMTTSTIEQYRDIIPNVNEFYISNITDNSIEIKIKHSIIQSGQGDLINYSIVIGEYKLLPDNGKFQLNDKIKIEVLKPTSFSDKGLNDGYRYATINITEPNLNGYYKVGIISNYELGDSEIMKPQNIDVFQLGKTISTQIKIAQMIDKVSASPSSTNTNNENRMIISGADGKFERLKTELGGYPDNLILDDMTGFTSLEDLIKRQLNAGIIDVNVHNS